MADAMEVEDTTAHFQTTRGAATQGPTPQRHHRSEGRQERSRSTRTKVDCNVMGFASDLLWRFVWLNSSTVVWVMENRGGGADPPEKWGKVSIFESIVKITLSPFYPLSLSFNIALVTTYLLEPGGMIVTVPEHCSAQLHYGTASSHGFRRGGCCAHLRRGWRGLHCRPSCCCHGHEPRHDDDDVKPRIRSADDDAANGHVSADADECRRWSSRPRGRQGRRPC